MNYSKVGYYELEVLSPSKREPVKALDTDPLTANQFTMSTVFLVAQNLCDIPAGFGQQEDYPK